MGMQDLIRENEELSAVSSVSLLNGIAQQQAGPAEHLEHITGRTQKSQQSVPK